MLVIQNANDSKNILSILHITAYCTRAHSEIYVSVFVSISAMLKWLQSETAGQEALTDKPRCFPAY